MTVYDLWRLQFLAAYSMAPVNRGLDVSQIPDFVTRTLYQQQGGE